MTDFDFSSLTPNQLAQGLGYFGAIIAMGMIPTWIAIGRKAKHLAWLIAANMLCGVFMTEAPAFYLVWVAILVWALWKKKAVQPVVAYSPYPQPPVYAAPPPSYAPYPPAYAPPPPSYPPQYQQPYQPANPNPGER